MGKIIRNVLMFITLAGLLSVVADSSAWAQKVKMGEKAPELRVEQWLSVSHPQGGARLVEFFHSSSRQDIDRIPLLESLASEMAGRLEVIVVVQGGDQSAVELLKPRQSPFYTMLDSGGKTLDNYDVKFVPYCVLIDSRGRVLWAGNASSLSRKAIEEYLE